MRIEPSALCVMLPPGGDPVRLLRLGIFVSVPRDPPSPTQTTVHRASERDFYQDYKWSRKKRLALIFNRIASVTFPHRFSWPTLSVGSVGGPERPPRRAENAGIFPIRLEPLSYDLVGLGSTVIARARGDPILVWTRAQGGLLPPGLEPGSNDKHSMRFHVIGS